MLKIRSTLLAVLASAATLLVVPACGTTDGGLDGPRRPGADGDGAGGDGTGDEDGGDGNGGSGGSGGWDDNWSGSDGGDEDSCSETEEKAQRKPLDMYIMLDRSGSMAWNINGSTVSGGGNNPASRWYQVKEAIMAFVTDPQSAGIGVGLNYFSGSQCSVDAYRNPAVGFGLLPVLAPAIESSLNSNSPNGGTPTRPALQGALEFAKERADTHPDHTVVVVLATDGQPEGCSNNTVTSVSNVAADYADNHGIKTFVIGISNQTSNLNTIAQAGGTGQAIMVTGSNAKQEFIDAMNAIRGVALACEYEIPPPEEGEQLDYEKVNLRFTAGDGTKIDIDYVGDSSQCGSGGWFYDDPNAPTMIHVCPETCEMFKADGEGQVNVVLGCKRRGPA